MDKKIPVEMKVINNIRLGPFRIAFGIVAIFFLFLAGHKLIVSTTHPLKDSGVHKFHHLVQKTVFDHNWEDIHCRRRFKNETHIDERWVAIISDQLNIKASHAVFDSNTGCNEWLLSLRKKFPKLTIGGAHKDLYAVEYAKRVFHGSRDNFYTLSQESGMLSAVPSLKYDHAINYAGLRELPKEVQCNLVKELLRIVKPGGSIYLGHNMEKTDCKVLEKYSRYVTLPGCYWSKCLENRTDVAEMYYFREDDLYGSQHEVYSCYAVFIHKAIMINQVKNWPGNINLKPKSKEHSIKKYYCKPREEPQGILSWAKQKLLKKHAIGHQRDIASSLHKFRDGKKAKKASPYIQRIFNQAKPIANSLRKFRDGKKEKKISAYP